MHPILGHMRQLGLYLLAWAPLSAILLYVLRSTGGLSWTQALWLVLPLCLVYAFMCLSACIPVAVHRLPLPVFPASP